LMVELLLEAGADMHAVSHVRIPPVGITVLEVTGGRQGRVGGRGSMLPPRAGPC
jgi:hypothetical protein